MDYLTLKALTIMVTIPLNGINPMFTSYQAKVSPIICAATPETESLPLYLQEKTACLKYSITYPKSKNKTEWIKKKDKTVIDYSKYFPPNF